MYFNNNGSIIAISSLINFHGGINLFSRCKQILPAENGGIVTSGRSTLHFYGITYFLNNYSPKQGGAIFATNSKLYVHQEILFANNVAKISGGGIYVYQSEFYCYFNCTFFLNYAAEMGGGVHAVSSKIIANVEFLEKNKRRYILFSKNCAGLGGAVYLEGNSKLSLVDSGIDSKYKVTFLENTADYGGAVYINDCDNVSSVCENNKYYTEHTEPTECFLLAYKLGESQELITF